MYSRVDHFIVYSTLSVAILLSASVISCRKKACDEIAPTIQIIAPGEGSVFYYQDVLNIEALITDNECLESIIVEVTDAQNNRYLTAQSFTPSDNRLELNHTIVHNDLYLKSGTYYVRITADDGVNEQIAFREIQLIEAPRFIERIFAISSVGSSTTIDTLHDQSGMPCINFDHAYRFGGIDSRNKQLVAISSSPSSLISYSLPFFENLNTPFPSTNDAITVNAHDKLSHRFLWGTQSGNVWSTSTSGTQLFAQTTSNSAITCIARCPSHIIVIAATEGESFIYALRTDNGIAEFSLTVDWEVIGAIHLVGESERVLLLGNQNGAAHFAWLNLTTSAVNEVFNFYESSTVQSAYSCENNDFIVIHEAGIARYYNLLNNYTLNTSLHPEKIVYDDLENQIWAVTTQTLYRMDGAAQSTLQTIPASNLVDVWILYNK